MLAGKSDILQQLKSDILRLEGFKTIDENSKDIGLKAITDSFPNETFPLGAVHEFLAHRPEEIAATSGFITSLLSSLIPPNRGVALWISSSRRIFPPGLSVFGVRPDNFVFIHLRKEKDIIWAVDEALRCSAISAVVGELKELTFSESRRLQLAVERSGVTGFILRNPARLQPSACVSRWKITSLPSDPADGLPGIGYPKWNIELLRVRNGKPGAWELIFRNGSFQCSVIYPPEVINENEYHRQAV